MLVMNVTHVVNYGLPYVICNMEWTVSIIVHWQFPPVAQNIFVFKLAFVYLAH